MKPIPWSQTGGAAHWYHGSVYEMATKKHQLDGVSMVAAGNKENAIKYAEGHFDVVVSITQ